MIETERQTISRLLIVEDDRAQLQVLTDIMRDEGFEVIGCSTAAAGLRAAEREKFAVVILDYRLPDLSGTKLLECIGATNPRVRAIIHTAYGSFHSAKDAVNMGAFAYVEKAGGASELVRQVHRAFREYAARYTEDLEAAVAQRTAELHETTEMLQALIEAAPIAIASLTTDGRVCMWNPAAEAMFGWSAAEALGQPPRTIPPDQWDQHRAMVARGLQGERHTAVELRRLRKDGTWIDVRLWTAPLVDPNHQIVGTIAIFDDITERKWLAEEAAERQAQLAHVMRLNMMGKMVSELAHEINQPLYAITNYASACRQVLQGSADKPGRLDRWVERISEQAERAGAIIRRLTRFVRKDESGRTTVPVNELIQEVVPLVEIDARRSRCQILSELEQPSVAVTVDRIQIEQVLVNLIVNAMEAMEELEGQAGEVTIRSHTRDGEVEIEVQDVGPGVSPEHAAQLFEPYFTTKPTGMGLGLPISRTCVEAHGGRLWATPNAERGMTFCFTLPLAAGDAADGT